jgi:hypothetical protein
MCGVLSQGTCVSDEIWSCLIQDGNSQLLVWSREEHHLFPDEFRAAVWQLVRGQHSITSILNTLSMDVLELMIRQLAASM